MPFLEISWRWSRSNRSQRIRLRFVHVTLHFIRSHFRYYRFILCSTGVRDVIHRVFHENGIPLGSSPENVALAASEPLPPAQSRGEWKISGDVLPSSYTTRSVKWARNISAHRSTSQLKSTDARLLWFTEQRSNWKLPLGDVQTVNDLAVDKERRVLHVLATRPAALFSLNLDSNELVTTALDRLLETSYSSEQCRFQMGFLNGLVIVFNPQVFTLSLVRSISK